MNPKIIKFTPENLKRLLPVTSVESKDVTGKFSEDGLFSETIFGEVGTEERLNTFSYIKLNSTLFSPFIYNAITNLSGFYTNIIRGVAYATWDEKQRIFEQSNEEEGNTGFNFFLKHFKKIKWNTSSSKKRDHLISMVEKYHDSALIKHFAVLPAGMRDMIEKDGKTEEDECNKIYRKIIMLANALEFTEESSGIDSIKLKLQGYIQEYYEYVNRIYSGKTGIFQNTWTKRTIKDGTRNVITASTIKYPSLIAQDNLGMNDSIVNVIQYCYAIGPKLDYLIPTMLTNNLLELNATSVKLVNKKTEKFEETRITSGLKKMFTSKGIKKMLRKLKKESNIFLPITAGNFYLMKVYDDGTTIKPIYSDDGNDDKKHIRLMTYMDFFCIAILNDSKGALGLMTRYPIASPGSIYPSYMNIKPTVEVREVTIIIDGMEQKVKNYPVIGSMLFNSLGLHPSKLANLGGDFDGDKLALSIVSSREAREEIKNLLESRSGYISATGRWIDSLNSDISQHVLKTLTKRKVK